MMQTTNNFPETYIINPNCILFDTCSAIISISNIDLVQDIRACNTGEELKAYTNQVHQDPSYTVTMMVLLFEEFYNKNYLANILPFFTVPLKSRVTIDTYLYPAINVQLYNVTSIMFNKCSGGLYYYDTTNMEHNIINSKVDD